MPLSVANLKNQLKDRFDLVCFIDLAEIATKHSDIFSIFREHRKDAYVPNQRLVFYSSHRVGQELLDHLQRAAARIDISNYFILICSPYDITPLLIKSNQRYGHDDSLIQWECVDLYPTQNIKETAVYSHDTMCPLLFGGAQIGAAGSVAPCCKFKDHVGNINKNSLVDIFYGQQMADLREQVRQGIRLPGCQVCWDTESLGGSSLRKHALDKYGDLCDQQWIDDLQIRDITITPTILCNFKCRLCRPTESSKIASEEFEYATDPIAAFKFKQLIKLSKWETIDVFRQTLKGVYHGLSHLHILGGEPFLLPSLKDLLTEIIDSTHSQKIQLEFNTNGSVWPKSIIPLFDYFKNVEILLSIDNIGPKFEIERGGVWTDVEQNIKKFIGLSSDRIKIKLGVTVNIQNVLYLDDLVRFSQQLGVDIVWTYLDNPDYLCIDNVTQRVKELVYEKYHLHSTSELCQISSRIQQNPAVDGKKFLDRMAELDRRRNQQFSITHREIFEAMGGKHQNTSPNNLT